MSAADPRDGIDKGTPRQVRLTSSEIVTVPYREAVGLVSRGKAAWFVEPVKPKRRRGRPRKKTEETPDLSGAALEGQDADSAENEPAHNLL